MSGDLNTRQALALLDSAERQIAAARALLGAAPATAPTSAREEVRSGREVQGERCPSCNAKGRKQKTTPIASPVETFHCGDCGYEYPTT